MSGDIKTIYRQGYAFAVVRAASGRLSRFRHDTEDEAVEAAQALAAKHGGTILVMQELCRIKPDPSAAPPAAAEPGGPPIPPRDRRAHSGKDLR